MGKFFHEVIEDLRQRGHNTTNSGPMRFDDPQGRFHLSSAGAWHQAFLQDLPGSIATFLELQRQCIVTVHTRDVAPQTNVQQAAKDGEAQFKSIKGWNTWKESNLVGNNILREKTTYFRDEILNTMSTAVELIHAVIGSVHVTLILRTDSEEANIIDAIAAQLTQSFNPGRGAAQAGIPSAIAQGGIPQQNIPRAGVPQSGIPQQGIPQGGIPQSGYQAGIPQAGIPSGIPQQGIPQQGIPQQGIPQANIPRVGAPQQGIPSSIPQHGVPQGGFQQGIPQQGGIPQGGIPQQNYQQGIPQQGGIPQQNIPQYPQAGIPQQGYQQGIPQGGIPQQVIPPVISQQGGIPQQGVPQYPQQGIPQAGIPQGNFQQGGIPQQGIPQAGVVQGGYGQQAPMSPVQNIPQVLDAELAVVSFVPVSVSFSVPAACQVASMTRDSAVLSSAYLSGAMIVFGGVAAEPLVIVANAGRLLQERGFAMAGQGNLTQEQSAIQGRRNFTVPLQVRDNFGMQQVGVLRILLEAENFIAVAAIGDISQVHETVLKNSRLGKILPNMQASQELVGTWSASQMLPSGERPSYTFAADGRYHYQRAAAQQAGGVIGAMWGALKSGAEEGRYFISHGSLVLVSSLGSRAVSLRKDPQQILINNEGFVRTA